MKSLMLVFLTIFSGLGMTSDTLTRIDADIKAVKLEISTQRKKIDEIFKLYYEIRTTLNNAKSDHTAKIIDTLALNRVVAANNKVVASIDEARSILELIQDRESQLKKQRKEIKDSERLTAENQITKQLLQRNEISNYEFKKSPFPSRSSIKASKVQCALLDQLNQNPPTRGTPGYQDFLSRRIKLSSLCYQQAIVSDEGTVIGFSFDNKTKNSVNPNEDNGAAREFVFKFGNRASQNMKLEITENSGLTGRMSHDLLHTTMIFLPRVVIPYVDINTDNGGCTRNIYLPSGEFFEIDSLSKQILGGVLKELPMDLTPSRHARDFAGIEYLGKGITIRADRRSGTPEHVYSVSFNNNERVKDATISYQGKTCYVPKELIWDDALDSNQEAIFRFETDQEFLDIIANPICKWDLTLDDITL